MPKAPPKALGKHDNAGLAATPTFLGHAEAGQRRRGIGSPLSTVGLGTGATINRSAVASPQDP